MPSCADATAYQRAFFGQGTGPILLDELRCVGTEGNLLNCPRNELAVHDCSHSEDASVECQVECKYCVMIISITRYK